MDSQCTVSGINAIFNLFPGGGMNSPMMKKDILNISLMFRPLLNILMQFFDYIVIVLMSSKNTFHKN